MCDGDGAAPMSFCYVVMSHREPHQVLALVRRIRELSPDAHVLVRHDQSASRLAASDVEAAGGRLGKSEAPVTWGDWSQMRATLEAFDEACERAEPDWLVFISGQDWPVRDLADWE